MKTYVFILIILSSCFNGPVESEKKQVLEILWSKTTNIVDVPNVQPLVIKNSQIVYAGEVELVSLDANEGSELWRTNIDGSRNLESTILLYDKSSGRIASNHYEEFKVWGASTGEVIYTLTNEDGILAFRRGRNTLVNNGYGFVGDTLDAYVINTDGSIRFKLSADFGTLAVGYGDFKFFLAQAKTIHGALTLGKIRAFDSQAGDSLWIYETDKGGFGISSPILENGVLYAGTTGNSPENTFVALDAETGTLIWEYFNSEILTRSFVLGPKDLYVNTGGKLIALNKENGQNLWAFEWNSSAGLIKPVYLNGYIYHSDHNRLFVVDAETGELVHEESSPGGFIWHVAASSDKIFVQTSNQLIAYQPWHLRED
ncbi:MAG: PQQ-binding-like beta-propeller repeat protein [Balneolaceae bacterium]|nr:PQQ-binding-like beta-propeller repeat protein [Balneolaceae bacterium]MBO6546881.1 PQQ-binding-like beta-propeller repeat protein [Balneolaceae bacterium]MBO6649241.1 PQQ-binding-like beta-propeller repeat protein [Balneolaceae bacterium]